MWFKENRTIENINKNETIKGIKIPNTKKPIKISQYADDENFFLKDQESIKNVLKYFENLKEATGTTINLEKTTVLPINIDDVINSSKQITIKEQFETIKILGIYLNEDLQYAKKINWENILEKWKNTQIYFHPELYLYTEKQKS